MLRRGCCFSCGNIGERRGWVSQSELERRELGREQGRSGDGVVLLEVGGWPGWLAVREDEDGGVRTCLAGVLGRMGPRVLADEGNCRAEDRRGCRRWCCSRWRAGSTRGCRGCSSCLLHREAPTRRRCSGTNEQRRAAVDGSEVERLKIGAMGNVRRRQVGGLAALGSRGRSWSGGSRMGDGTRLLISRVGSRVYIARD